MQSTRVPQGTQPPIALTVNIAAAGIRPPPPGPLAVGVTTLASLDLTTVTGASIAVRKPDGSVVQWSATYAAAPSLAITGATAATPIVVTVDDTTPLRDCAPTITIAGVEGLEGANGAFFAQVLGPTTFALFEDPMLLLPVMGTGDYTSGGTATPNTTGTVVHDFAAPTSSAPSGDLDQIGVYQVVVSLSVAGGIVPCSPALLEVVAPFADGLG